MTSRAWAVLAVAAVVAAKVADALEDVEQTRTGNCLAAGGGRACALLRTNIANVTIRVAFGVAVVAAVMAWRTYGHHHRVR